MVNDETCRCVDVCVLTKDECRAGRNGECRGRSWLAEEDFFVFLPAANFVTKFAGSLDVCFVLVCFVCQHIRALRVSASRHRVVFVLGVRLAIGSSAGAACVRFLGAVFMLFCSPVCLFACLFFPAILPPSPNEH